MKKFRIQSKVLMAVAFALVAMEMGVRMSGLVDFPTYTVASDIGYLPKPVQSGSFLNKNSWVFNDRSMGTEVKWDPERRPNILFIGNSIVMGGNPYAQQDKLGPLLQRGVGDDYAVWPIASGGWTNVNQMVYLEKNPDVAKEADFFIWEYMSGGLSQLSPWRGEYVFPSETPSVASWYVIRRYVLPRFFKFNMNELPPTGQLTSNHLMNFEAALARLSNATGKKNPGILFFYPGKEEFLAAKNGVEWLAERKTIEKIAAAKGLKIVHIDRSPEWNENLYRDGVHPTPAGNAVLANILTAAVKDALSQ